MSLETLYEVSQIVAVVAILGSLIAIFFQMRQGQKIARADSQRDLLNHAAEFMKLTLDNPAVLEDVRRGLMEYDTAPTMTKSNFSTWAWVYMFIMETCTYMRKDGLITKSSFDGFETGALGIISTPGGHQWWQHTKKVIGVDVSRHLDTRLMELGDKTPLVYEFLTQFAPIDSAENSKPS